MCGVLGYLTTRSSGRELNSVVSKEAFLLSVCLEILSVSLSSPSLPLSLSLSLPLFSLSLSALGSWEKFEDSHHVSKKLLSSVRKGGEERGSGGRGGAVCAADAMVSDSQWTALDDSRHRELFGKSGRLTNN